MSQGVFARTDTGDGSLPKRPVAADEPAATLTPVPDADQTVVETTALSELPPLGRAPRPWLTVPPYLVGADLLAVVLAVVVVPLPAGPLATVAVAVAALVTVAMLRGYRPRLSLSIFDELPTLAAAALAGCAAGALVNVAAGSPASTDVWLARVAALTVLLGLGRTLVFALVGQVRRRRIVEHRAIVIGAGEVGRKLAEAALAHPVHGLRPIGFVDSNPAPGWETLPVPLLGGTDELAKLVRREGATEILVAFTGADSGMVETMRQLDTLDVEVFAVPRFFEVLHRSRDMDEIYGIPLVRMRRRVRHGASWGLKRAFDVVASATTLLLIAPLLALIAAAVRIELGRGVLFRQERVGLDGRRFTILKFRSLRLPTGPDPDTGAETQPVWSINGDARLGRVGRFIRATSLDELPQLFNVLRGEMSIVGPRPERLVYVEQFRESVPGYDARHRAPAGLTGWAQVNGLRGDTSIADRARFDNYYIQNWSLWLDVKIIMRTIVAVLRRHGS